MSEFKRKWEKLTDEQRQASIEGLIHFFENERDEKIGVLAAEKLLDFFQQNIGVSIYNKGVTDAKVAVEKRIEDLQFDLDDLIEV